MDIRIPFDIETFKYNMRADNPREWNSDLICCQAYVWGKAKIYKCFSDMMGDIVYHYSDYANDIGKKPKSLPVIELWAHNGNKYDNHFLLRWLKKDLGYKEYNEKRKDDKVNFNQDSSFKFVKDLLDKEVLTSRVKTSSNLSLQFIYSGILFKTRDSVDNTHRSLADIGKGLRSNGLLLDKHLKTDFDYDKFDLKMNLSERELIFYKDNIYHLLLNDVKGVEYCLNDVIILNKLIENYNKLFLSPLSLSDLKDSQGLLKYYTDASEVNKCILTNKAKALGGKDKEYHLKYSEYASPVKSQSMYQYLSDFYRGGLCMYNENYLSKIVDNCVVCDINSSYPAVMYNEFFPFLVKKRLTLKKIPIKKLLPENDYCKKRGVFHLFNVSCETLNKLIVNIKSNVLKKAFVKYRARKGYVSLNSYDIKFLIDIAKIDCNYELIIDNGIEFITKPASIKKQIEHFYILKTKAKLYTQGRTMLEGSSPIDIRYSEGVSGREISKAEVDFAKYCMNGIYGLPALSETYDVFTLSNDGKVNNNSCGLNNTERNILFSLVVTAKAFYNLLRPMSSLQSLEVDDAFVYCDTDSLIIKREYIDKLDFVLHDYNLGCWDRKDLSKVKVINHKMYTYETVKGDREIKAAGIARKCVGVYAAMSFQDICEKIIANGAIVNDINSVMTINNVPVIYSCKTEMKGGACYRDRFLPIPKAIIAWLYKNKVEGGFNEFVENDSDISGDVYDAMGYTLSKNEIVRLYNYYNDVEVKSFRLMKDLIADMAKLYGIAVNRVKKEDIELTFDGCFKRFLKHTVGRYDNAPLPKVFRGLAVKRYRSMKVEGESKPVLIPRDFLINFWEDNYIVKKLRNVLVKTKDDAFNFLKVVKSAWFVFRSIVQMNKDALKVCITSYNLVRKFTCTKKNIDICKIFGIDFTSFGKDKRFRSRFFKAIYEKTFGDYVISTPEQAAICLRQCAFLLFGGVYDSYTKEGLNVALAEWRARNANPNN